MATNTTYHFDWSDLAFGNKKLLRNLEATFIVAPRDISVERFTQLVKTYLPTSNIVVGISKEPYVDELPDQPQFRMLEKDKIQHIIDKIAKSSTKNKVFTLSYSQRELSFILEKISFKHVVFVRGSWYRALHFRPEFYILVATHSSYERVSPFSNEEEARAYASGITLDTPSLTTTYTELGMLSAATEIAKRSYDYSGFQIGAILGVKKGARYHVLAQAHNQIVPYETYAMHHGASREEHFSVLNDANHYDTVHAETQLIIQAAEMGIQLNGSTLFVTLLPCPSCARMLASTSIAEIVYSQDHSNGYAIRMLEASGKKVRRIVL